MAMSGLRALGARLRQSKRKVAFVIGAGTPFALHPEIGLPPRDAKLWVVGSGEGPVTSDLTAWSETQIIVEAGHQDVSASPPR